MVLRIERVSVWMFCGLLLAAVAACGDTVKIIECPPGTVPEGSKCVPVETPDAADATIPPDIGPPDTATSTVTETTSDETAPDTTEPPDVFVPRATGGACQKNADCAGGTCLDWTGGYCTKLDCTADGCGANETCITFAGNHLCVANCARDTDCRSGDQACKTIVDQSTTRAVCIGVDADAHDAAESCVDPTDCDGAMSCLGAFPGGYCATLGCPANACSGGTTCVKVDGRASCLKACQSDDDCPSAAGAERKCGVLQATGGSPAKVCISGVSGKGMGETCLSDFECDTGNCQILGEGRCSQTNRPCFPDRAADDCNGAEFCLVNGQNRVGLCSQPCRAGGIGCPGASYCVTEGDDPNDAWCRAACTAAGPDAACNASAGLLCAFGIPLTDGAQGRYVCGRARVGVLTTCTGDAACGDHACLLDGASGYCTEPCGDDAYCPFAGACVVGAGAGGGDRCQRACFSVSDCPAGFNCTLPTGATRTVCTP